MTDQTCAILPSRLQQVVRAGRHVQGKAGGEEEGEGGEVHGGSGLGWMEALRINAVEALEQLAREPPRAWGTITKSAPEVRFILAYYDTQPAPRFT